MVLLNGAYYTQLIHCVLFIIFLVNELLMTSKAQKRSKEPFRTLQERLTFLNVFTVQDKRSETFEKSRSRYGHIRSKHNGFP
jgi:hypothetical protein